MTLYEINKQMEELLSMIIDPDTGEITDPEALADIQMKREDKLEAIALVIKNNVAEAALIRAEENELAKRRHRHEKTAERLKKVLENELAGQAFETAKCSCSFRRSTGVVIDTAAFNEWAKRHKEYVIPKDPVPDKTAIKAALVAGNKIPCAELEERLNMTVN
jgi:hypothetical protein